MRAQVATVNYSDEVCRRDYTAARGAGNRSPTPTRGRRARFVVTRGADCKAVRAKYNRAEEADAEVGRVRF